MQSILIFLVWLIFWASTVAVILVDQKLAKAAAAKLGQVDFTDRRLSTYFLTALMIGGFVLVFYFWTTRRSAKGALLGLAVFVGVLIETSVLSVFLSMIASIVS